MCSVCITNTTKMHQEQGIVVARITKYRAYRLNIYRKQSVVVAQDNHKTKYHRGKICTKSKPQCLPRTTDLYRVVQTERHTFYKYCQVVYISKFKT